MSNQFFQYSLNSKNNQDLKHLATLNPAQSDGLIKCVQSVIKFCNPTIIYISKSQIFHWFQDNAGVLSVDLLGLLEAEISIGLINHRGLTAKLQSLKNGKDLTISTVHQGQFHRFVAGSSEIDIPAASFEGWAPPIINLSDAVQLGTKIEIHDTTPLTPKAKTGPVRILIHSDQLSVVWFVDGSTCHFSRLALSECPSPRGQVFRSFSFLRCTGKKADLKIFWVADEFYLVTESAIGVGVKARIIEPLFTIT